ncbi:MAG: magnesium transporter [Peptoniphilaceae bacterium]|nr:magnesium transporter [Peptoniphilaceae bacterium]MDY6018092.1 magnesium transporter [Anaerococcus sp.]
MRQDINYDFEERIELLASLLSEKKFIELADLLSRTNPIDVEEFISNLSDEDSVIVFRLLKKDDAAEVFAELDHDQKQKLLSGITDLEVDNIFKDLNFDDMIDTLEEMPASFVKKVLKRSDSETRKLVNEFLNFPEDSAGSLMTTEYVELKENFTVGKALDLIKETSDNRTVIYTCYVTGAGKKLLGFVSLRTLVTSNRDVLVKDLMYEDVISVGTHDDQEDVAKQFGRYGFTSLPVVDSERRMVGIITVDDIFDVMEEETTEDFQKMAATTPDEAEYLDSSVWQLAKNRLPWLLFLMVSGSFTSTILKNYQNLIQSMIALNIFVPMLTDSGGNAGSQASTLVIRGMATGEIDTSKDWLVVIFKELRVGLLSGFIMGIVACAKCVLFDKVNFEVGLIVGVTILVIITIAKIVGSMLPMLAKKLNFDPAIMASPLITTIVDSIGLICYFEVANIIMSIY